MSYAPTIDFLALLRTTAAGVTNARVPGLDYVVAALVRAGMFQLSVSQTAPIVNQSTTAWLKPALPSWTAEGVLFLWNVRTLKYEIATPALWTALLGAIASGYSFQLATAAANTILAGTSLLAVQRAGPVTTSLVLPNLAAQWISTRRLQIVDFSTAVTGHTITLTTADGATIMQKTSWGLFSSADQLAGVMLQPTPDLNSWIIAP
jgi:hypothetical protein